MSAIRILNDETAEDREAINACILNRNHLNIQLNWQYALLLAERQKMLDFLSSLGCPFSIEIKPPCEGDESDELDQTPD